MKQTVEYAGQITFSGENSPSFTNFFPNPWGVREYGHKRIFEVLVREPKPGETAPYWSWWDEKEQRFEFTWAKELFLEMCFAYGTKAEEERGHGKKVRTVEILREIKPEEVNRLSHEIAVKSRARRSGDAIPEQR